MLGIGSVNPPFWNELFRVRSPEVMRSIDGPGCNDDVGASGDEAALDIGVPDSLA